MAIAHGMSQRFSSVLVDSPVRIWVVSDGSVVVDARLGCKADARSSDWSFIGEAVGLISAGASVVRKVASVPHRLHFTCTVPINEPLHNSLLQSGQRNG